MFFKGGKKQEWRKGGQHSMSDTLRLGDCIRDESVQVVNEFISYCEIYESTMVSDNSDGVSICIGFDRL